MNSEIPDNVIEMLGLDGSPERDPDKIAHLAIDFYIDRLRFIEEAEDMPMVALLLASRACKELTNNKKNTHKTLRKWQISVLRYFWRMEMWAKSDDFPCPFDFDGPAPHKSEPANTLKGTASELLFLNAIQAAKSLNPIWGNMEEFKRCSNEHKDTVNDYIKNMLEPQWSSLEIDRVLIGRIEKAEISSLMSKNSDKAQRPHDAFFKLVNAETDRLIAPTKKAGIAVTREMALAFFKASVEVISDGLSKDESDKVSGMESATINTRFKRYFAKSH